MHLILIQVFEMAFLLFNSRKSHIQNIPFDLQGMGIVDETIDVLNQGRVFISGSWWPARSDCEQVIPKGQSVKVTGLDNITLIVRSVSVA